MNVVYGASELCSGALSSGSCIEACSDGSSVAPPWPRFTVRDFQYNEEEMKADKEEMTRLSTDKKKQFVRISLGYVSESLRPVCCSVVLF